MRLISILLFFLLKVDIYAVKEIPRPNYYNSFLTTFHHHVQNSIEFKSEVDLLKSIFQKKPFNRLGISEFITVYTNKENSSLNKIKVLPLAFQLMTDHLKIARDQDIGLHLGLVFGFVRNVWVYNYAKKEDIRNCQWYGDGKLASDEQLNNEAQALNTYIWLTLSRYAFSLRDQLRDVCLSMGAFLSETEKEYWDTLLAVSGAGEVELNYHRIDFSKSNFPVTDYSPFVVMEFRDWLRHTGIYGPDGKYYGQGYQYGGSHYQGEAGLNQLNLEMGTDFKSWNLKYYNFNPVNQIQTKINWDSIPDKGDLLLGSGSVSFIEGGFDPPRNPNDGSTFWAVWNRFRQEMVRNFTRDIARWIWEGGFRSGKFYAHQIPADYLWGNAPDLNRFEHRLLSSASPLWAADNPPYQKIGVTCFNIKFPDGYVKTTEYLFPYLKFSRKDWAILEFDPSTIPPGFDVIPETDISLLKSYWAEAYFSGAHLIANYRWIDSTLEHQFKGSTRVTAFQQFWNELPQIPWRMSTANMSPPPVIDLNLKKNGNGVGLNWSDKIWYGLPYTWANWILFDRFVIYRRNGSGNFARIGETKDIEYIDKIVNPGLTAAYYVSAVFKDNRETAYPEIVNWNDSMKSTCFARNSITLKEADIVGRSFLDYMRIIAPENQSWALISANPNLSFQFDSGKGSRASYYHIKPFPRFKKAMWIENFEIELIVDNFVVDVFRISIAKDNEEQKISKIYSLKKVIK